ncbi:MAG: hypothetical protein MJY65_00450 [Bacteroidaceae bacterium]|nr:hypothetical protein [Bacteroidaceae bacterium]
MASMAAAAVSAQTSYDAFQLMGEDLNGTARYVGMGGAMNAFGNDISVMAKNPAGIGTYVTDEVNTTLSFSWSGTDLRNEGLINGANVTSYSDRSHSDLRVGFDNASFVMVMPCFDNGSPFRSMNIGFSYHRLRDSRRSLDYYDYFRSKDGNFVFREMSDVLKNRVNAYDFNVSFNCNDSFYWGMTVETLDASFSSDGFFYDSFRTSLDDDPQPYTKLSRYIDASARGWSFKGGAIYRPQSGNLRFGLAFSTPTFFHVNQYYTDYQYALDGEIKDGKPYDMEVPYDLTSPWTLNASIGYSAGRNAIGLEYEYNAVGGTRMNCDDREVVTQCGDLHYKSYSVLRVGYETNISNVSLRCGYNYTFPRFHDDAVKYRGWYDEKSGKFYGDTPFNGERYDWEYENVMDAHTFTAGIGYCSKPNEDGEQFYVDGTFMYNLKRSEFCLGEYADDPIARYNTGTGRVLLTVGVLF